MRADVPPDLLAVLDAARHDQRVQELLIGAPRAEVVGDAGAREALEDLGAVTLPARVGAAPERRVYRHGEDVREEVAHGVHDLDARFVVLDGDVHVLAEDQVRPRHHLQVLDQPVVVRAGRDRHRRPMRERVRAGGGDAQAVGAREADDLGAQPRHLAPRLLHVAADRRADLDDRVVHLALDLGLEQRLALRKHLLDVRLQLVRRGIDDLELFLDPDRERRS